MIKLSINFLILSALFSVLFSNTAVGQNNKIIQLSGLIVGGDSLYGIPGAYVYIPKTGRGTTSNYVGYFSLPALTGDTVLIKAIGFKQKKYVIPQVEEKYSVVLELSTDTSVMPVVEVFPWSTEKSFKEAFLALDLDNTNQDNALNNLNPKILNRMMINMPDDGSLNHRYFINQQIRGQTGRYFTPSFNLIDPFAWKKFLKSIEKGEHKHREE